MSVPKGSKVVYFSKAKEARQAILDRSLEILETYLAVIAEARAAGEFEIAEQGLWKLIEHIEDDDGIRIIESSVDKPKQIQGNQNPTINIGFKIGGINDQKALPPVIDITPVKDEDVN